MDNTALYTLIDGLPGLSFTGGVDNALIADAETKLNLKFAQEYISYLQKYGQLEAKGIELTGLSSKSTTSVVNATRLLRRLASIPEKMYVIEDLGIDGIEYLQDNCGTVYQYSGPHHISVYAQSLTEYIQKSQE